MEFRWNNLFEAYPYSTKHTHFLQILLTADNDDELQEWVGWVKSRIRGLLLKVFIASFSLTNPGCFDDFSFFFAFFVCHFNLFLSLMTSVRDGTGILRPESYRKCRSQYN